MHDVISIKNILPGSQGWTCKVTVQEKQPITGSTMTPTKKQKLILLDPEVFFLLSFISTCSYCIPKHFAVKKAALIYSLDFPCHQNMLCFYEQFNTSIAAYFVNLLYFPRDHKQRELYSIMTSLRSALAFRFIKSISFQMPL